MSSLPATTNNEKNVERQRRKCERIAATKQVLPKNEDAVFVEIQNLEVYEDDVWVVTIPKAGTHWMQETLCYLLHDINHEKLKSANYKRAINIEMPALKIYGALNLRTLRDVEKFHADLERPRVMKSHLSWDNLPKKLRDPNCKAKIVYVARNPKDVFISRFYYTQMFDDTQQKEIVQSFAKFADAFLGGKCLFMPYWSHVFGYWIRRDSPKVLFVKFEEMKADFPKVLDRLQVFLGLDPLTQKEKNSIAENLKFENMRKNKAAMDFMHLGGKVYTKTYTNVGGEANFMRKGKVGGWKEEMSSELIQRFDEWILENTADTGYSVEVSDLTMPASRRSPEVSGAKEPPSSRFKHSKPQKCIPCM